MAAIRPLALGILTGHGLQLWGGSGLMSGRTVAGMGTGLGLWMQGSFEGGLMLTQSEIYANDGNYDTG